MKIDVFTSFESESSCKFANNMKKSLSGLSSANNFRWHVLGIRRPIDIDGWNFIQVSPENEDFNSIINFMYPYIDSDFVVVAHADIMVCKKYWDRCMIGQLHGKCIAVGAESLRKLKKGGKPCLPVGRVYTVFTMFVSDIIKRIAPDLRPVLVWNNGRKRPLSRVVTDEESVHFNLPKGYSVKQDGGFKLPLEIDLNGYSECVIKSRSASDSDSTVKWFDYVTPAEWRLHKKFIQKYVSSYIREYYFDDNLFFTHLGRSIGCNFDHPVAKMWRTASLSTR